MSGPIERRVVVAPVDQEVTAIVRIPLSPGGEVEIDRMWRFIGFEHEHVELTMVGEPNRVAIQEPDEGWADEEEE